MAQEELTLGGRREHCVRLFEAILGEWSYRKVNQPNMLIINELVLIEFRLLVEVKGRMLLSIF